ncbi:DUF262 domain-containing protein [Peptoniphilus sp. DNF00840]|uniref:DUF262 domain-containing protein n=1 Tax=Peptoniphilus sp. DNF00840 TaxID=1477000 RepID=UPI0007830668|nr:DUF262 domain-containing protein [Peptoniphilus sp. DNF00840]
MSLQKEINERSSKIFRDSYQMSIGELINIYKDEEMDIHPEFQRVFRWSEFQKTRLIESIMLNIPIPSIFVSQNDEGIWDVIDGVQRLSTIFQFVGIFKDDEGKLYEPLILQKTDYLPSFEGMMWTNSDPEKSFTKEQQLAFKRSRIDVIIVKKESDPNTKYELFQRLNTGGSKLSDQEVRNCLMIMTNREFYFFINELSTNEDFNECIPITDRKEDEQFKLELILRLLISSNSNTNDFSKYDDLKELLDRETISLIEHTKNDSYESIKYKFNKTFKLLNDTLGEDSFKKYSDSKHKGAFLVSAFQGIATGVYFNINKIENIDKELLSKKIKNFYEKDEYINSTKKGARAVPRFIELTEFGKEYFSHED